MVKMREGAEIECASNIIILYYITLHESIPFGTVHANI